MKLLRSFVLMILLCVPVLVGRVGATAAVGFSAVASAEGIRSFVFAEGAPVANTPFDGGSPVAQASLDSNGASTAFGSVAYPGDLAVSAPGLIAGLGAGRVPPVPNYPVIARADSTKPHDAVSQPGVAMTADATGDDANASAAVGASSAGASAPDIRTSASVVRAQGGLPTALGQTTISALSIGPVKIGEIRGAARTALRGDGTRARSSSFEVSGLEVAGLRASYGTDGLQVGGTKVPADLSSPGGEAFREALAQQGVELRLFSEQRTAVGVVSGGMQVAIAVANPTPVSPARLTLTFGRVVAGMATGATVAVSLPAAPNLTATPDIAGASTAQPLSSALASPVQSPPVEADVAPSLGPSTSNRPVVARPLGRISPTHFDLTRFYSVLVVAALVVGGAGQALRKFGERARWT
jgi:hypothetical protein